MGRLNILRAYEAGNAQAHLITDGLMDAKQEVKVFHGYEEPLREFQPFDILHVHGVPAASRIDWSPFLNNSRTVPLIQYETEEIRSHREATRTNFYAHLANDFQEDNAALLEHVSSIFPACIVDDVEAAEYASKYHQRVYIVPPAIQPVTIGERSNWFPRVSGNRLVIVHFAKESSGSEFVEKAIGELKKDGYPIRYKQLQGFDPKDALAIITRADIVIDQLLHGMFGTVSIQAMALGKPVLSHIREDLKPKLSPDLPVISANPATLYRELIPLINNKEWRQELGNAGRMYAEKNHYIDAVIANLLNVYNTEIHRSS